MRPLLVIVVAACSWYYFRCPKPTTIPANLDRLYTLAGFFSDLRFEIAFGLEISKLFNAVSLPALVVILDHF